MEEKEKTKGQLIDELMKLQRQITELEKSEIRHQQIEKASTDNEEKYRILVELAADGILIETVEGRILKCNTAGAKIYGYAKEEIIGLTIADLVPEEFSKKLPKVITDKGTSNGIFVPRISKKKDGTIFPTEIATKIVRIGGKPRLIAYVRDITKPKEAEKKLRKARKMFASLFNSSPIAALYHDEDGRILNINPYFTKTFGYTLKEIIGRNIDEGMIYPENKIDEGERLTKKGLTFTGISEYETVRKKKDGTLIYVVISASPVIIDGQSKGVIALFRDINERKQDEQLHQVLYHISKVTNSALSLDQLYPLIHQELGSIIDTTNFYIALVDEKEDKIFFPYNIDHAKPIHLPRTINHNSLVAEVIRTGKSILVNQEMIKGKKFMEEFKEWFGTLRKVWLGVPLKIEDKTIGVMAVQSYTNPELYSEKDIKLLEFVSSQVATAIERKKAEETLQKSQQEFASLFMNSPEALIYLDEKSTILNINPRFTKLFGYTLEEIKGKNINEGFIYPPDKIKEGKKLDKIASSKGYFHYETIRKKKDGTLFPVSISGANIKIDGQTKGLTATYIDITERKRLEKRLEKLAHFDVLTGCYARGYGLSLFERQIKSAQRRKTSILLLYLDLDGLKYINDTFGHKEGDKALKEAAKFFKSTLREVDIICRMGGDEFLLIFPDSSLNDVPLIKERITNKLKELNKNLNNPYKISFSVGLSCYNPSNPLSIEELIKIADENMYEEKKKKK